MCEKNHYGRKAVTILLAVLTALLVLSFMTGSRALAAARPSRIDAGGDEIKVFGH